jgi:hypothetical protein
MLVHWEKKKHKEALSEARKEVCLCLEVNIEKIMDMFVPSSDCRTEIII